VGWISEHVSLQRVEWPESEDGRAKVAWHLMQEWAKADLGAASFGGYIDRSERHLDARCRIATEAVVEPLIEYLQERIDEASDVLYLVERYVRRVE
jgi:hypothetical protein